MTIGFISGRSLGYFTGPTTWAIWKTVGKVILVLLFTVAVSELSNFIDNRMIRAGLKRNSNLEIFIMAIIKGIVVFGILWLIILLFKR